MGAEAALQNGPRRKTKRRILVWVFVIIVVLAVLVVFLVPWFVSSEKGRQIILAKINGSIDGKADFSNLSMSWWRGIKVTGVSFNDGAGQTLIEAKQIITKPHYCSILTGSLSLGETIVDEPKVQINLAGSPAKMGKGFQQKDAAVEGGKVRALPIKKIDLVIKDGNLKVTDRGGETVELSQINSELNLRSPGQQTNFDIDMAVVDKNRQSKISAGGQINPKSTRKGWTLKGTSGELTVEVNDLELGSLGPIFALAGVDIQAKGNITANIKNEIKDGQIEKLSAEVKGRDLDVNAVELIGGRFKTGQLDVNVKLARAEQMINIESFDVEADWLKAQGRGTVPTTFGSLAEFLKTDSSLSGRFELDVAQIFTQMPRTFGLKEGIKVTSGMLSGDIETLTEDGKRKINGRATLERLAGVVSGKTIALSEPVRAEVEITSDKDAINFDKLDLSSAFAKINCSGTSELLKYRGDVDLATLQAELGQFADIERYEIAGELFSEGEVSIKEDKVAVDGSSAVKNLRLSSKEGVSAFEPMADISFGVSVKPDKSIVEVDSIKASASFGQVSIKDAVVPLSEEAEQEMLLAISAKVDLAKLQPFAVLLASFPRDIQLAGLAESNISVSSKEGSYRIVTDSARIENFKLISAGQEPFEQEQVQVIFDAEVNPAEKTIDVRELQLISPQIKIHKGELKQVNKDGTTTLEGRVDCEYDWAAVSTIASAFLPEGLKLEGKRKDTINFSSEYPTDKGEELLANLSTEGKVGFERAEYMGFHFGPTEVDIQIDKGLMRIAPFSTTVNNGQLNFAGEADFKEEPTLLKTPGAIEIMKDIQINEVTTDKLLMYVNPVFANAVNVSGIANFNCERLAIPLAGATKNDLEVTGTISVNRLRLEASDLLGQILSVAGASARGQDITINPTRFVLQDGFLRYDDMEMVVGDNPVNFGGVIGLDKSLKMTVTLPYTTRGRTVKVGEIEAGERISLPLRGTINRPELDLGKLLEEQLKQQLKEKLQDALEELLK
jgi:hypothetical protein